MGKRIATAVAYLAAAIFLTWPAARLLGDAIPGSMGTDVWNSVWSLGHWVDALTAGQRPWRVDTLNFPHGGGLLVSDPIGASVALPFHLVFGGATAFTLLVWFQLTFSGFVMHCFAEDYLTWRRGGGAAGYGPWVSGFSMMMAPLLASHVHNGATEALAVGPTILSVWLFWRAAVSPSSRRILWATLGLPFAALAHGYGGVVAAVFGLSLSLMGPGGGHSRWDLKRWIPLVLGGIVTGLLWSGIGLIHQAEDALSGIKTVAQVRDVTRTTGAADLISYFRPGEYWSPDFRTISRHDERFMHVHYLGFVLMGLSGWAWIRRRRHTGFVVVGGLVCLVLSLGPVLIHEARPLVFLGDLAVPLPFFLFESLPGFSMMPLIWTLALGPVIALSLLAGLALDLRGWRLMVVAVLGLTLEARVLSPAAGLPGTVDITPEASILGLRAAPEGAVVNYPIQPGRAYLAEQRVHRKPIAGLLNQVANTQAMRLWGRILTESKSDPDTFHRAISSTAERLGIRYVVIHTDPDAEPDLYTHAVGELERLFGVPEWGRGQTRVVKLW